MTSKERLQTVLAGGIPDHVPVAPDTSNMIPARMTGKPFWEIYLYQNPPQWLAYLNCVKYFGFDSLMDGYVSIDFDDLTIDPPDESRPVIVFRGDDRLVTRRLKQAGGKNYWADTVDVFYRGDPPTWGVNPLSIRLPAVPDAFDEVEGVRPWPRGGRLLALVKDAMGDHGLVGVFCGTSKLVSTEAEIYDYFDHPEKYERRRDELLAFYEKKFSRLMELEQKPDFICTGASGTLVHQSAETFRSLGLPIVKRMTALAKQAGLPSHIHSCGPERLLVRIAAEETCLTVIDPLEIAPMGDCDLRELKRLYGKKLVLKGNLHTTDVMLRGTPAQVADAAKRAIDDAAAGGGFILSTGDQCGRDTPDENLFAMIETAKTYGRY